MRAIIQRVQQARVDVHSTTVGKIDAGLLVLLGVHQTDTQENVRFLAEKIVNLRIFPDAEGKMNLSLLDNIQAESESQGASHAPAEGHREEAIPRWGMLVVSQFTLYGDCRKGRRPSFVEAAPPVLAKELYEHFCREVGEKGVPVQTGIFQADMQVYLCNDGPVTLIVEG